MGWLRNIEKKVEHIMATQAELLTQVRGQAKQLNDVLVVVGKIKADTASLLKEVQDLKDAAANQDVDPELKQAIADVGTAADNLKTSTDEVDAEVPDPVPSQG